MFDNIGQVNKIWDKLKIPLIKTKKEKVYCSNCINSHITNQPFDITECLIEKIIKTEGDWKTPPREIEIRIVPYMENVNNDCKYYKAKDYTCL